MERRTIAAVGWKFGLAAGRKQTVPQTTLETLDYLVCSRVLLSMRANGRVPVVPEACGSHLNLEYGCATETNPSDRMKCFASSRCLSYFYEGVSCRQELHGHTAALYLSRRKLCLLTCRLHRLLCRYHRPRAKSVKRSLRVERFTGTNSRRQARPTVDRISHYTQHFDKPIVYRICRSMPTIHILRGKSSCDTLLFPQTRLMGPTHRHDATLRSTSDSLFHWPFSHPKLHLRHSQKVILAQESKESVSKL